jgi:hypothetical protein
MVFIEAMWHCEMKASSLSGPRQPVRFHPENPCKTKKIAAQGCMARSNVLYDGQNMHMIEKQLRLQTGAPFGQA